MASSKRLASRRWEHLLNSLTSALREHAEALILAVVLGLLVRAFVLSGLVVRSAAMAPSLLSGDFVLAYKLPFGLTVPFAADWHFGRRLPSRGDLVVFTCPGRADSLCLKRVIGLPGDRLERAGHGIALNGKECRYSNQLEVAGVGNVTEESCSQAPYRILRAAEDQSDSWGPIVVPPERVFVLNDNRADQSDSREWDSIPANSIQARAVIIWLSFDWGRPGAERSFPLVRWNRLFRRLN